MVCLVFCMCALGYVPPVTRTVFVGASTLAVVSAESLGSRYSPETASKTRMGGKVALDVMVIVVGRDQ